MKVSDAGSDKSVPIEKHNPNSLGRGKGKPKANLLQVRGNEKAK